MRNLLVCLLLLLMFFGCDYSKKDLVGIYVKTPSVNTNDTLYLYKNNEYTQKVYFKTGELFGVNKNKWSVKDGRIDFMDFYLNYDFDLKDLARPKDGKFNKTSLMPSLLPFDGKKIIIDKDRKIFYLKTQLSETLKL